ncbi:MAG: alkaline phosphatase family protein [Nitrososphaerales archaeon]
MKRKIILFGIDGATWTLIDKYASDGYLPTFDHIMSNGARATLLSTIPAVTLPAWTSMFTGVNPAKHGLTDFILRTNGKFTLGTSNYRMVDTVWQIMSKKGLKSIVVNDPSTYPPYKINGIMTTGLMTPPGSNYVYPRELKNEIERVASGYWADLPLDYYMTVNRNDTKAYSFIEEFANKTANVGLYLAENYEWDMLAVIFVSTDKIQHTLWHKQDYILKHYIQIDTILKRFLDVANKENATIFIASDHGFGPLRKTFYINTWLAHTGLQKRKSSLVGLLARAGLSPTRIAVALKKLHLYEFVLRNLMHSDRIVDAAFQYDQPISMEDSEAFAKAEGIFINSNLAPYQYEKTRDLLVAKLKDLRDNGIPVVSKVYTREEVMHGPYIDRAPDILFTLNDGYCPTYYSDGPDSQYIGDDKGGYKGGSANTGIHRPEGIFISYGSEIRKFDMQHQPRVWDLTPTILHMMGLPIPSYMDGHVLKDIFTSESQLAAGTTVVETSSEKDKIKNRLRQLKSV